MVNAGKITIHGPFGYSFDDHLGYFQDECGQWILSPLENFFWNILLFNFDRCWGFVCGYLWSLDVNRSYRVPGGLDLLNWLLGLRFVNCSSRNQKTCVKKSISKSVVNVLNGDIRKKQRQCHLLKKPCQRSDHKPNLVFNVRLDHQEYPYCHQDYDPSISGTHGIISGTPKSSILIRFSIINHPFWGTPIFGNTYVMYRDLFINPRPCRWMASSSRTTTKCLG